MITRIHQGISFYELEPDSKRVSFVRDIPEPGELLLEGGGVCGTCYDFFINHFTSITLATALLTDV
jgi:hypothetical protein